MAVLNDIDIREEFRKSNTTFIVQVKIIQDWRFRLGLRFLKWGCQLKGCALRLEEPEA